MYLNNLTIDITELQAQLDERLDLMKPCQREIVRGVLEVLKTALGKIGETNYGCCQELCIATACWDSPEGLSDLSDSAYVVSMSNIGTEKKVSPKEIQDWWQEDGAECQFTKAVLTELGADQLAGLLGVEQGFQSLGITPPSQVIVLVALVALVYVVLGDPIILLHNTDKLLSSENLDTVISNYLPNWRDQLETLSQNLLPDLQVEPDELLQLIGWVFSDFQNTFNQVAVLDGDDPCNENDFGIQFPSWPGVLWLIVNATIGVVGSFWLANKANKFGGGLAPIGPQDPSVDTRLTHHICEDGLSHLSPESPINTWKVLRTEAGNCGNLEELGPPTQIRIKFSQKIHSYTEAPDVVGFEDGFLNDLFNGISVGGIEFQKSSDGGANWVNIIDANTQNITAGPISGQYDTLSLSSAGMPAFECGDLVRGVIKELTWDDQILVPFSGDKCDPNAWKDIPVIGGTDENGNLIEWQHSPIYPTFSDTVFWACESVGDGDESGIQILVEYITSWWQTNYGTEFNQTISILQGLGLLNGKGSVFAGFLHPDGMCSPYLESIICRFLMNDCDEDEGGFRDALVGGDIELFNNAQFPRALFDANGDGINDDLPQTVTIGNCDDVEIPQWLRSWYEEHRSCLYLKLPYDPCSPNDCARYSHEEQMCVLKAVYGLIDAFVDSTPFGIGFGFEDWPDMKRYMSVVPVAKRQVDLLTPNYAGWEFGCLPEPNVLSLPYQEEVCVECCDIIACECCGNYPCDEQGEGEGNSLSEECGHAPEDCCDCAVGSWSANTSYPEGIIISHDVVALDFLGQPTPALDENGEQIFDEQGNVVFLTEEACFKALKETCAPDENPTPGTLIGSSYWSRCTPVCEWPGSYWEPRGVSCDITCLNDGVGSDLTDFEEASELFTAIEYSGNEGTPNSFPDLPTPAPTSDCVFNWQWRVEEDTVIYSEGNPVSGQPVWSQNPIEVRNDTDTYYPSTYKVALGEHPDGAGAATSAWVAKKYKVTLSSYDQNSAQIDFHTDEVIHYWSAFHVVRPNGVRENMEPLPCNVDEDEVCAVELHAIDSNTANYYLNDDQFSIRWNSFLDSGGIDNVCDYVWVWEVHTSGDDPALQTTIPYYGGVGKIAQNLTVGAIRNPSAQAGGDTVVYAKLYAYPASYDALIQERLQNWDCVTPEYWTDLSDGFDAMGYVKETLSYQLMIPCYCYPTDGGLISTEMVCNLDGETSEAGLLSFLESAPNTIAANQAAIGFERGIYMSHTLPEGNNGCQGSWRWRLISDSIPADVDYENAVPPLVYDGESLIVASSTGSAANSHLQLLWMFPTEGEHSVIIQLEFCPEQNEGECTDELWSIVGSDSITIQGVCSSIPVGLVDPSGEDVLNTPYEDLDWVSEDCSLGSNIGSTVNFVSDVVLSEDNANAPQLLIPQDPYWDLNLAPDPIPFSVSARMTEDEAWLNSNLPLMDEGGSATWFARWVVVPSTSAGQSLEGWEPHIGSWQPMVNGVQDLVLTAEDMLTCFGNPYEGEGFGLLADGYTTVDDEGTGRRAYHILTKLEIVATKDYSYQGQFVDSASYSGNPMGFLNNNNGDTQILVQYFEDPDDMHTDGVHHLIRYTTVERRVCNPLIITGVTSPDVLFSPPQINNDPEGNQRIWLAPYGTDDINNPHQTPGTFFGSYTLTLDTEEGMDEPIEVGGTYQYEISPVNCAICSFNIGFQEAECEIVNTDDGNGNIISSYFSRYPFNMTTEMKISTECGISHDDPNLVVELYDSGVDPQDPSTTPILTLADGDLAISPDEVNSCWEVTIVDENYRYQYEWSMEDDADEVVHEFLLYVVGTDNEGQQPIEASATVNVPANGAFHVNDHFAQCEDGTVVCIGDLAFGCTDENACNYDPDATCDNGLCYFTPDVQFDNVGGANPLDDYWLDEGFVMPSTSIDGNSYTIDYTSYDADGEGENDHTVPPVGTSVLFNLSAIFGIEVPINSNIDLTQCFSAIDLISDEEYILMEGTNNDGTMKNVFLTGSIAAPVLAQGGGSLVSGGMEDGVQLIFTGDCETSASCSIQITGTPWQAIVEANDDCNNSMTLNLIWNDIPCYGVTDENACNYDPNAVIDYGTPLMAPVLKDNIAIGTTSDEFDSWVQDGDSFDITAFGYAATLGEESDWGFVSSSTSGEGNEREITLNFTSSPKHIVYPDLSSDIVVYLNKIVDQELTGGPIRWIARNPDTGAEYYIDINNQDHTFSGSVLAPIYNQSEVFGVDCAAIATSEANGETEIDFYWCVSDCDVSDSRSIEFRAYNEDSFPPDTGEEEVCIAEFTLNLVWDNIPCYGVTEEDACNYEENATIEYGEPIYPPTVIENYPDPSSVVLDVTSGGSAAIDGTIVFYNTGDVDNPAGVQDLPTVVITPENLPLGDGFCKLEIWAANLFNNTEIEGVTVIRDSNGEEVNDQKYWLDTDLGDEYDYDYTSPELFTVTAQLYDDNTMDFDPNCFRTIKMYLNYTAPHYGCTDETSCDYDEQATAEFPAQETMCRPIPRANIFDSGSTDVETEYQFSPIGGCPSSSTTGNNTSAQDTFDNVDYGFGQTDVPCQLDGSVTFDLNCIWGGGEESQWNGQGELTYDFRHLWGRADSNGDYIPESKLNIDCGAGGGQSCFNDYDEDDPTTHSGIWIFKAESYGSYTPEGGGGPSGAINQDLGWQYQPHGWRAIAGSGTINANDANWQLRVRIGGENGITEDTTYIMYAMQCDENGAPQCHKIFLVNIIYSQQCNVDLLETGGGASGWTCESGSDQFEFYDTYTQNFAISWDDIDECIGESGYPLGMESGQVVLRLDGVDIGSVDVISLLLVGDTGCAGTVDGAITLDPADQIAIANQEGNPLNFIAFLKDLSLHIVVDGADIKSIDLPQLDVEFSGWGIDSAGDDPSGDDYMYCENIDGTWTYSCPDEETCECDCAISGQQPVLQESECVEVQDGGAIEVAHKFMFEGAVHYPASGCSNDMWVYIHDGLELMNDGSNIIHYDYWGDGDDGLSHGLVDTTNGGPNPALLEGQTAVYFEVVHIWDIGEAEWKPSNIYASVSPSAPPNHGGSGSYESVNRIEVDFNNISREETNIDCICLDRVIVLENAQDVVGVEISTDGTIEEGCNENSDCQDHTDSNSHSRPESGHIYIDGSDEVSQLAEELQGLGKSYNDSGCLIWDWADTNETGRRISSAETQGNENINIYSKNNEKALTIEGEKLDTVHLCGFGDGDQPNGFEHVFLPEQVFDRAHRFNLFSQEGLDDGYATLEIRMCNKWHMVQPVKGSDQVNCVGQPTEIDYFGSPMFWNSFGPGHQLNPLLAHGGWDKSGDGADDFSWIRKAGWVDVRYYHLNHLEGGEEKTCVPTEFRWSIHTAMYDDDATADEPPPMTDVLFRVTLNDPNDPTNCQRYYLLISSLTDARYGAWANGGDDYICNAANFDEEDATPWDGPDACPVGIDIPDRQGDGSSGRSSGGNDGSGDDASGDDGSGNGSGTDDDSLASIGMWVSTHDADGSITTFLTQKGKTVKGFLQWMADNPDQVELARSSGFADKTMEELIIKYGEV